MVGTGTDRGGWNCPSHPTHTHLHQSTHLCFFPALPHLPPSTSHHLPPPLACPPAHTCLASDMPHSLHSHHCRRRRRRQTFISDICLMSLYHFYTHATHTCTHCHRHTHAHDISAHRQDGVVEPGGEGEPSPSIPLSLTSSTPHLHPNTCPSFLFLPVLHFPSPAFLALFSPYIYVFQHMPAFPMPLPCTPCLPH